MTGIPLAAADSGNKAPTRDALGLLTPKKDGCRLGFPIFPQQYHLDPLSNDSVGLGVPIDNSYGTAVMVIPVAGMPPHGHRRRRAPIP